MSTTKSTVTRNISPRAAYDILVEIAGNARALKGWEHIGSEASTWTVKWRAVTFLGSFDVFDLITGATVLSVQIERTLIGETRLHIEVMKPGAIVDTEFKKEADKVLACFDERAARRRLILALSAASSTQATLRTDHEGRAINRVNEQGKHHDRFEVQHEPAVGALDVQRLLMNLQPDVVHFCGHGIPQQSHCPPLLMLSTVYGAHGVPIETIRELFSTVEGYTRCVVLNACYSEPFAHAIAAYIDCVVGVTDRLHDQAGIAFAAGFYQALASGSPIGEAFRLGEKQALACPDAQGTANYILAKRPDCDPDRIWLT